MTEQISGSVPALPSFGCGSSVSGAESERFMFLDIPNGNHVRKMYICGFAICLPRNLN
jgi:hypothetical protein